MQGSGRPDLCHRYDGRGSGAVSAGNGDPDSGTDSDRRPGGCADCESGDSVPDHPALFLRKERGDRGADADGSPGGKGDTAGVQGDEAWLSYCGSVAE